MSRTSVSIRADAGRAEQLDLGRRQIALVEDPGAHRVVDVVVDVGDPVDQPHDPPLERRRLDRPGVVEDPVAHLLGEVEPAPVALELVDDAQRVHGCAGSRSRRARAAPGRAPPRRCARTADGRGRAPSPIASVRSSLRPSAARHRAGDEAGLERVGEPGPVVVALGGDEHLRLVLQPPERLRVRRSGRGRAETASAPGCRARARADGPDTTASPAPRGTPPPSARTRSSAEARRRLGRDPLKPEAYGGPAHARRGLTNQVGEPDRDQEDRQPHRRASRSRGRAARRRDTAAAGPRAAA